MSNMLTNYQQRWLTGIGLLLLVGFIGWVDNYFVMWVFLGVIYIFAFFITISIFKGKDIRFVKKLAGTFFYFDRFYSNNYYFFLVTEIL